MLSKRLCAVLSRVWKCIALFLRLIINRKPKELDLQDSLSGTTAAKNDYKEHPEWRSDEWEDFTVSVAKFEPPNETSMDVFSDMQPVIKKAKTICIHMNKPPERVDFTVQDCSRQLPDLCTPSDLGTWNDGSNDAEGWEDELLVDENDVIQESKSTIKEKRRQERLHKHQTKKFMRAQQKASISQPSLGIKTVC